MHNRRSQVDPLPIATKKIGLLFVLVLPLLWLIRELLTASAKNLQNNYSHELNSIDSIDSMIPEHFPRVQDSSVSRRELKAKRTCGSQLSQLGEFCGPIRKNRKKKKCCDDSDLKNQMKCVRKECIKLTPVFFIGNSFTIKNNLPSIFKGIAVAKTKPAVVVSSVLRPATTLSSFATWSSTYSQLNQREYWHSVVLQEQSQMLQESQYRAMKTTYPYAEILSKYANNQKGAHTVLFMTWGYAWGDPGRFGFNDTYHGMQNRLIKGYKDLAEYLVEKGHDVKVAPVGEAWNLAYDALGDKYRKLYQSDGRHPSKLGSTLAGYTLYCTITGKSPMKGKIYKPRGVSTNEAKFAARNAEQACFKYGHTLRP